MTKYSHTFEMPGINDACADLIAENAEQLINYINENMHRHPYDNPVTRVGLVFKILLRTGNTTTKVSEAAIEQATTDLKQLLSNSTDPVEQKIYTDELIFLRKCTALDDLISLNTRA